MKVATHRGYLKETTCAADLQAGIQRLRRAGVPLEGITIGGSVSKIIDTLGEGDSLTVCFPSDLSHYEGRLQAFKSQIERRCASLRILEKEHRKGTFVLLLQKLRLCLRCCFSRRNPARKRGRPSQQQIERRIDSCLMAYYHGQKSVREVCRQGKIRPVQLYEYLKEHRMPSRFAVKNDPWLDPLRKDSVAKGPRPMHK